MKKCEFSLGEFTMVRLFLIMMIAACFCVTGCKKKESPGDAAVQKKTVEAEVNTATKEVETTTEVMGELQ